MWDVVFVVCTSKSLFPVTGGMRYSIFVEVVSVRASVKSVMKCVNIRVVCVCDVYGV